MMATRVLFFCHQYNTALSATYPAPIMSIFEIRTWIGVYMRKPLKNFWISAQGFYRSQITENGYFRGGTATTAHFQAVRIILGTCQHPKDAPFMGEFWWGTYHLSAIRAWKNFGNHCHQRFAESWCDSKQTDVSVPWHAVRHCVSK